MRGGAVLRRRDHRPCSRLGLVRLSRAAAARPGAPRLQAAAAVDGAADGGRQASRAPLLAPRPPQSLSTALVPTKLPPAPPATAAATPVVPPFSPPLWPRAPAAPPAPFVPPRPARRPPRPVGHAPAVLRGRPTGVGTRPRARRRSSGSGWHGSLGTPSRRRGPRGTVWVEPAACRRLRHLPVVTLAGAVVQAGAPRCMMRVCLRRGRCATSARGTCSWDVEAMWYHQLEVLGMWPTWTGESTISGVDRVMQGCVTAVAGRGVLPGGVSGSKLRRDANSTKATNKNCKGPPSKNVYTLPLPGIAHRTFAQRPSAPPPTPLTAIPPPLASATASLVSTTRPAAAVTTPPSPPRYGRRGATGGRLTAAAQWPFRHRLHRRGRWRRLVRFSHGAPSQLPSTQRPAWRHRRGRRRRQQLCVVGGSGTARDAHH